MPSPTAYFSEAIEELHHVRWPTRQQAVRLSMIVLAFTLVSSFLFGIVDLTLAEIVSFLLPSA